MLNRLRNMPEKKVTWVSFKEKKGFLKKEEGGEGGEGRGGEGEGEEGEGGGRNKCFTTSLCSPLTNYNEVIHFELTGVDLSKLPEDCLWQTQRKSFVLHLAVKLGNHYPFTDEHR